MASTCSFRIFKLTLWSALSLFVAHEADATAETLFQGCEGLTCSLDATLDHISLLQASAKIKVDALKSEQQRPQQLEHSEPLPPSEEQLLQQHLQQPVVHLHHYHEKRLTSGGDFPAMSEAMAQGPATLASGVPASSPLPWAADESALVSDTTSSNKLASHHHHHHHQRVARRTHEATSGAIREHRRAAKDEKQEKHGEHGAREEHQEHQKHVKYEKQAKHEHRRKPEKFKNPEEPEKPENHKRDQELSDPLSVEEDHLSLKHRQRAGSHPAKRGAESKGLEQSRTKKHADKHKASIEKKSASKLTKFFEATDSGPVKSFKTHELKRSDMRKRTADKEHRRTKRHSDRKKEMAKRLERHVVRHSKQKRTRRSDSVVPHTKAPRAEAFALPVGHPDVVEAISKSAADSQHTLPPLAFLKTHKTGSSTITSIVHRLGDSKDLTFFLPDSENHSNALGWPGSFPGRAAAEFNGLPKHQYDIICNHAIYDEARMKAYLKPDPFFFTVLRDPMTQAQSAFDYYKPPCATDWDSRLDWMHQLKTNKGRMHMYGKRYPTLKAQFLNPQATDLGWYTHNGGSSDYDDDNHEIDAWIKKIDSAFGLVILTEYFDEGLILLSRKLHIKASELSYLYMKSGGVHVKPGARQSKELRKNLNVDVRLYQQFNRTFWREWDEAGSYKKLGGTLKEFRHGNKRIQNACSGQHRERCPWNYRTDSAQFTQYLKEKQAV